MNLVDRFTGSLLGVALGDAMGAPHEGHSSGGWHLSALRRPDGLRWTDDTQMTLVLARSLAEHRGLDADQLAMAWATAADASRGYGGGAIGTLALIRRGTPWQQANRTTFPTGSFGNGAAMRAAPLGLFFHDDPPALDAATWTASSITHAHPLGIDGGLMIARAVAAALTDASPRDLLVAADADDLSETFRAQLQLAADLLERDPSPREVADELGNGVAATESVVTALYVAARHLDEPFENLIRFTVDVGGDVDTLAAMAGGIWGARRSVHELPQEWLAKLEAREEIEAAARELWRASDRSFSSGR